MEEEIEKSRLQSPLLDNMDAETEQVQIPRHRHHPRFSPYPVSTICGIKRKADDISQEKFTPFPLDVLDLIDGLSPPTTKQLRVSSENVELYSESNRNRNNDQMNLYTTIEGARNLDSNEDYSMETDDDLKTDTNNSYWNNNNHGETRGMNNGESAIMLRDNVFCIDTSNLGPNKSVATVQLSEELQESMKLQQEMDTFLPDLIKDARKNNSMALVLWKPLSLILQSSSTTPPVTKSQSEETEDDSEDKEPDDDDSDSDVELELVPDIEHLIIDD